MRFSDNDNEIIWTLDLLNKKVNFATEAPAECRPATVVKL